MEEINELDAAINNVLAIATRMCENTVSYANRQAPLIIHQRLCHELVEVMKANPKKLASEIPAAMKILDTIEVLEEFYPELKSK